MELYRRILLHMRRRVRGCDVSSSKSGASKSLPAKLWQDGYTRCRCPPCLIGPLSESSGRAPPLLHAGWRPHQLLSGFSGPSCVNDRPRRRLTRSRGLIQPSLIAEDSQSMEAVRPRRPTAVLWGHFTTQVPARSAYPYSSSISVAGNPPCSHPSHHTIRDCLATDSSSFNPSPPRTWHLASESATCALCGRLASLDLDT